MAITNYDNAIELDSNFGEAYLARGEADEALGEDPRVGL